MAKSDREAVQDHYQGHEIDIDTAVDRFEIMQEGANPNWPSQDDDTESDIGSKTPPKELNDPYCNC